MAENVQYENFEISTGTSVPSVEPIINITPPAGVAKPLPALLAPPPITAIVPEEIYISANIEQTGDFTDDASTFEITFDMSSGETSGKVTKKIQVSKSRLMNDLKAQANTIPVTMVEDKKAEPIKNTLKSEAQRMRELAGIPHRKNHT